MVWYVNASFGSDATSDATNMNTPTETLAAGISSASAAGHDQIIEITDEGRYYEGEFAFNYNGWTVRHTASELGRPSILGTDVGSGQKGYFVRFSNITGAYFEGLEIGDYSAYVFHNGDQSAGDFRRVLKMSGCFTHSVSRLTYFLLKGKSWTVNESSSFEDCAFFFKTANVDAIRVDTYAKFNNCLITATLPYDDMLLNSYNGLTCTASFCTFIARPTSDIDAIPIVRVGKIINSIVVASSSYMDYGVASDDHSYCAVYAGTSRWRNQANDANGSAGTGDLELNDIGDVGFQDSSAINASPMSAVIGSYILQSDSALTNRGTAYEGITTDISGSSRTVNNTSWNSEGTSNYPDYSSDFVINKYLQQPSQYKYAPQGSDATYYMGCFSGMADSSGADAYTGILTADPGNLPFSFAAPGPPNLRRRTIAYVATQGSNPKTVIE